MKLTLELNNQAKAPVKKAFFGAVVKRTLEESHFGFLKNISISIAVVDEKEIKRLNRVYRRKNETTDILSFPEYKNAQGLKSAVDNLSRRPAGEIFLGELVLCYNDIRKYAKKENLNLKNELTGVVAHGVLHLLGLRHGQKMFSIQREIIKNSGQKRQ